jgi:hypothetical protein
MKLWKTAGLIALVAAATPALAATGQKVESEETVLSGIEPRSAGELRASANNQIVRSDAVKWDEVWGPTVPKSDFMVYGEPVRTDAWKVGIDGRS